MISSMGGANKTGDGGDHLFNKVLDGAVEMELKTLDLLGKGIQENKSMEDKLKRMDLDIVSNIKAVLAKQREELMKHLQKLVADKDVPIGELLPSKLELVMHIRNQTPGACNIQDFFSTMIGKIVQKAHKNILVEATTRTTECVICLSELEGSLRSSEVFETVAAPNQRKRGCFLPCMHASVCILCCDKIWEGPQVCPLWQTKLTERPKTLFL